MRKISRMRGVAALVALASASFPATAAAQAPDPFVDYEAMKQGQAPPPASAEPAPGPKLPAAKEKEPERPTAPWKWTLGGRGAFSYTGIANDTLTGKAQSNTTLFFRLTPVLGVTMKKNLLVTASFGLLGSSRTREDTSTATELSGLFEVTGHFILPLTKRLAFLPGLGLGPYFGTNERELKLPDGRKFGEPCDIYGFGGSAYVIFGYQITQKLELRTGIALYALAQTEFVESANKSLTSTAIHVGLPLELHYHL